MAVLARGYPDQVLELFVPGTAVDDVNNTDRFGEQGENPLIAMYTSFVSR